MKLDTVAHGYFTDDNKYFINLEVGKSHARRKGEVISIEDAGYKAYPTLKEVKVKYPDGFIDRIGAYDLNQVNESIHCYYSPMN